MQKISANHISPLGEIVEIPREDCRGVVGRQLSSANLMCVCVEKQQDRNGVVAEVSSIYVQVDLDDDERCSRKVPGC
jgi:hypothetical protein